MKYILGNTRYGKLADASIKTKQHFHSLLQSIPIEELAHITYGLGGLMQPGPDTSPMDVLDTARY